MPRMPEIEPKTQTSLDIAAMCVAVGRCVNCPISKAMKKRAMDCVQFQDRYPMEAAQLAREWKEVQTGGKSDAHP